MEKKYVICAIIKDEQRFLKEWIDYHLNLGFNHIYLYEDYDSTSHAEITAPYEKVSLFPIETTPIPQQQTSKKQIDLYNWFLNKSKSENIADWILYIDIDEFLVFEDGYNIQRLCKEFEPYTGVYLCWRMYNANGHIKRPKGGVMESYTQESRNDERADYGNLNWQIKSFVNVKKAYGMYLHEVFGGVNVEHGTEWPYRIFKKAWINHYFTKSWEDYVERMCKRGNMSKDFRTYDHFFENNKDMLPLKEQLINSVRNIHTNSTFWISEDLKLISGGNVDKLKKLNNGI